MFFCFLEHADLMTCSRARVFSTWTDEEPGYTSKDAWPAAHMVLQIHAFCCWSGLFDRWRPSSHTCSFDPYTPSKQCWPDREFLCKSNLNFVWFSTPSTWQLWCRWLRGAAVRKTMPHKTLMTHPAMFEIFCLGRPCPTGKQKERRWQRMLGEQHCIGSCFFNTLSLRAFPGHVAISGLGSRQQPKKKNTTVEMESRCWGRTMMVEKAEGGRIEMVKVGTGLWENRWECARAVNVRSQL